MKPTTPLNPPPPALPPGLTPTTLVLTYLGEPFDWFRVEDAACRIWGSGFTAAEAAEMARREVGRRGRG